MRIFLLGSKGFHTRVGSPSTLAAVGMGPVLVICLSSVAGALGVAGADEAAGADGAAGGVSTAGDGRLMTVGCTGCSTGAGAGAGAGVGVDAGGAVGGFGAAETVGVTRGVGVAVGTASGPFAGAFGGAGAEVVMYGEGAAVSSQVVVCTGSSCLGCFFGGTARG